MTISRRGLFSLLAAAPVAAAKAVRLAQAVPLDPPLIAVGEPLKGPLTCGGGAVIWTDDYPVYWICNSRLFRATSAFDIEEIEFVPQLPDIQFANTGQPDQSAPVPSRVTRQLEAPNSNSAGPATDNPRAALRGQPESTAIADSGNRRLGWLTQHSKFSRPTC